MPKELKKNIQLSEKIQFLNEIGWFNNEIVDEKIIHHFITDGNGTKLIGYKELKSSPNRRLLTFVNEIIQDLGLYQMIQKYLESPSKFKKDFIN